ncbi:hypothetical protein OIDMADRAFT_178475 [Oidiodendron maius Zn]|uniref:Uncharacterized protein n=1 Tax=Oidiodendron maius (strain Zn) TaxID=913774 RepID=A0A0C3H2Z8_OIDMZ|nr:hypothetical protein OIDMADRAFT_178475 [Oidiodendron maius Zn]
MSTTKPPSAQRPSSPTFTPSMQDAQARNKDPYALSSDSESESSSRYDAYGNDTYEAIQLRREAAVVLDTPELLMMHAQARGDSIPATRYHFMKQLCGYVTPPSSSQPSSSGLAGQGANAAEGSTSDARKG